MKDNVVIEAKTKRNFVKYRKILRGIARVNRRNQTQSEKVFWQKVLRNSQLGYKFTRQKPIGRFVVDFYCSRLCLIVEVDGYSHDNKTERDGLRDQFLKQCGLTTIRYRNEDILNNVEKIKIDLGKKIEKLVPSLSREG